MPKSPPNADEAELFGTVPHLHLLKAEDLPQTAGDLSAGITRDVSEALSYVDIHGRHNNDREVLRAISVALASLSEPGPQVAYRAADRARMPDERYEEHDLFFRAVRVDSAGQPISAFLRTQLEAYRAHVLDALSVAHTRSPLTDQTTSNLRAGFHATFALLRRYDTSFSDPLTLRHAAGVPVERRAPRQLERWILGHQAFFAMIQSLLASLNCAISAIEEGDAYTAQFIDTATIIMRGSAAAIRYAGDFSPVHYAQLVRPAMMPPNLKPKFSGLQSRDHRYLLKVLATLRGTLISGKFDEADGRVRMSYENFLAEMQITYDDHKYVCSRFGGDSEPSLRMNSAAQIYATTVLERLKQSRVATAGLQGRSPLDEEPP